MTRRDVPKIPEWRIGARGDCPTGKVAFPSKAIAKRKARTMPNDQPERGKISAYRCVHTDVCMGWHVGHLPPQVRLGLSSRMDLRN